MSRPMLIRSTTVPPVVVAAAPKPAQQAQPLAGAAAPMAAARPVAATPAQAAAVQQPPPARSGPAAAAVQPPAQPVPDANDSLAHMQAALNSFAAGVAVRVPPGQERRQHVSERLHVLATQFDALLKGFWQQQGPK